jgi:6-phosphogluconolactonase
VVRHNWPPGLRSEVVAFPRTGAVVAPDIQGLVEVAAAYLVDCAAAAVEARGQFMIALSGGSTPRRLYETLTTDAWRTRIAWHYWHVFWGDERLVPADHADSNVGLADRLLLDHVPVPRDQVHRVPVGAGAPDVVAQAYEDELRHSFHLGPGEVASFDLIFLGLGSDGHIASLFPGKPALDEKQRMVVASPPGVLPPPIDRVTFTYPVLNAARAIAFLVAGADKRDVLTGVLAGTSTAPAAAVRPAGQLRWFVDATAAGGEVHPNQSDLLQR